MKTLERLKDEFSLYIMPTLCKMYGTVAQHYGFCGPQYLSEVERYVTKAQKAFGNGAMPEFSNDCNRQWNYLVYAYLDACRYDEAEEALKAYLSTKNLSRINVFNVNTWNDFHHAAFTRFVADTRRYIDTFLNLKSGHLAGIIKNRHPWQFWASNVSRIVENHRLKLEAWENSYRIATNLKGPAVAFALLPLSAMFVKKLGLKEEFAAKIERIKKNLLSSQGLNKKHFESLWEAGNWENILQKVWHERHILFPLTYR